MALLLASCGHPPKREAVADKPARLPIALLVEDEISGRVLGQPLRRPFGLATDGRGAVYLCDAGNNRILKFSSDLAATAEIGGFGTHEGAFNRPTFLSMDHDLSLLVSDEGNRRVCRYNARLQFVEALAFYDEEDPLKYGYPSGVNLTDFGETWVADRERDRIVVFNNVGAFDRFIGEFGYPGGQLLSPEKIVKDRQGGFVVCDAGNARLVVYDEYGNFSHEISDPALEYPISAARASFGLWLLDRTAAMIYAIDLRGKKILQIGPSLTGDARKLKEPSDLIALGEGRLLISDSGNNRLLVCRILVHEP